jgi:histone-lysine N-methyltransferase SETD2
MYIHTHALKYPYQHARADTGFYVDGKKKGNYSRFINHSCDPNCQLERWVVRGRMRIGIFAIRDIAEVGHPPI